MHEHFRAIDAGKIGEKALQRLLIVNHIPAYLYYLYHSINFKTREQNYTKFRSSPNFSAL